jgi:hypothetical protein
MLQEGDLPSAFGHDTWQLGFAQRVCNGPMMLKKLQ